MRDSKSSGKRPVEEVESVRSRKAKLERLRPDATERKKAEEALERSKKKWETTFNAISDWVVMVDVGGRILRTNRVGEKFTGVPLDEIVGQSCCRLVHGSEKHIPGCPLLKMLETGQRASAELQVPNTDQWVMVTTDPVTDEEGEIIGAVHITRDITERKRAEEEIRRLAKFPSENPNPVLRISADGTVLYSNEAGLPLLAKWGAEVGQHLPNDWRKFTKDIFNSGSSKDTEVECESRILSLMFAPVVDFNYLNVYALDITERKKAEEKLLEHKNQLRSMASELSLTEERERRRIATELHDTIGQSLVISKIKLDALRTSAPSADIAGTLGEVCESLDQAIQEAGALTFDLSSPILYELGFEPAVASWLTGEIEEKHGIATELEEDKQPKPLDDDVCVLLFRDVRELFTNVVKHARAKKIKVSICRVGGEIHVSVEDDGVGFDPAEIRATAVRKGGFGLFSIRERLEQLGGHLELESAPGQGTKATLIAPLKHEEANKGEKR